MKLKSLMLVDFFACIQVQAQEYFPTNSGVKTTSTNVQVFKNAKIHVNPTHYRDRKRHVSVKDGREINFNTRQQE